MHGYRRGRGGRTLRVATPPAGDRWEWLADRSVLFRIGLTGFALVALLAVVQAWKPPFPYRLDQICTDGFCAKIDFRRVNEAQTARARERAAEQVPLLFRHNPKPLERLPQDLSSNLARVAQADSLAQLPAEVRSAFGLGAVSPTPPQSTISRTDRTEGFQNLKAIATDQQQLQAIISSFSEFVRPLSALGVLRPEHFPVESTLRDTVAIVHIENKRDVVSLTQVQLPQLLAPGGMLHGRWEKFPNLLPIKAELESWLLINCAETLTYDDLATQSERQAARQEAQPVLDVFNAGDLLCRPGELVDRAKLELLLAEYNAMEDRVTWQQRLVRVATVSVLLVVLAFLLGIYLVRRERELVGNSAKLAAYLALLVGSIAVAKLVSVDPWRAEILPLTTTVMLMAIVFSQLLACVTGLVMCLIVALAIGADLPHLMISMGVCAAAVIQLPRVSTRSTLVLVGLTCGFVYLSLSWGTALIDYPSKNGYLWDSLHRMQSVRGFGWCLAAGFLLSGSLPFLEAAFGVVTDISLLELGDVSHPLLQELVRRAPGTYNHSITVASLGETAADAIGANGLLVRVGAYFHDVGKMLKPHYFVENYVAGQENRHEHLAPAMSALVIIGHVKDGSDLAEQHHLPRPLIDFIEQHHGTTLVAFFFHEATKQTHDDPDHRTDALESHFRYPGPKPQTREAAVLMLTDAVEGACRTLSEPTSKRIERLVNEIAMQRLLDGQFDECGLTLTELNRVQESLIKSLIAMYHARVKYPEQRTA